MKCLFCDSEKHRITYCNKMKKTKKNYLYPYICMESLECPEFEKMNKKDLKLIAYFYCFTKTLMQGRSFTVFQPNGKIKIFDYDEQIKNFTLNAKRQRYYKTNGYDPININLPRKQLIDALKERWKKYYLPINKQREKEGIIKNLKKCSICFEKNVQCDLWHIPTSSHEEIALEGILTSENKSYPPLKCAQCKVVICFECWFTWMNTKKMHFSCPQCRFQKAPIVPKFSYDDKTQKVYKYNPVTKKLRHVLLSYWDSDYCFENMYIHCCEKDLDLKEIITDVESKQVEF